MQQCPNCATASEGRFCPQCGQRQSVILVSAQEWLRELADELFLVDAKLPRTLTALVLRPGRLTAEWVAGRRARYVSPIRIYLVVAAVFFFLWPHAAADFGLAVRTSLLQNLFQETGSASSLDPAKFDAAIEAGLHTFLLVFSVPILAWLSRGGWGANRDSMVLQMVFSLHLHAFGLVALLTFTGTDRLVGGALPPAFGAWVVLVYMFLAGRRVFGTSWPHTIIRSALLTVTYTAVMFLALGIYAFLRAQPS